MVLVGSGDDDSLREQAVLIEKELERRELIDRIDTQGMSDPERLGSNLMPHGCCLGLAPSDIAVEPYKLSGLGCRRARRCRIQLAGKVKG